MNPILGELVISFGKIGLVSLGGGNSMIKLIEFEAITNRHWIGEEEFIRMVGSSFLFPGLTAVKLSALIGYKTAGILGLLLSVLSINVPGLLLAVMGFGLLNHYSQHFMVKKIIISVQYGALALLLAASFSVAEGVITSYSSFPVILLTIFFGFALLYWQLSPFWGFVGFIGICAFFVR